MLVPKVVWIIVEDSHGTSSEVQFVLKHCEVESVQLSAPTTKKYQRKASLLQRIGEWTGLGQSAYERMVKGVEQRNAGLGWLRDSCSKHSCNGIVYFADDDNTYSMQLFEVVSVQHATLSVSNCIIIV